MSHTKEPWVFREQGEANQYYILTESGKWVLGLIHNGEPLQTEQIENMRRIVVCVNACAGIQTEFLELGESEWVKALSERNKIKQQRDELLAALKFTRGLLNNHSIPVADAAIAKVEAKS